MTEKAIIVGVDIGGTFTDLVYRAGEEVRIFKLLTTRENPAIAFLKGLDALGVPGQAIVVHGTTVATNAVLEHKGARTALITTAGFRDVLVIGRQNRPHLYRLSFPPRWVPVPDELRFEVRERVSAQGEVLVPLDPAEVDRVLDEIAAQDAESLAVVLLFSFANPEHEKIIGEKARERGLFVSLSSRILPEYREFERTSTTVLNAYVSPIMARYLRTLQEGLARRGHHTLWMMQSSGGIIAAARAAEEAVRTILSGPAAGVTGAFHVASLAGYDHIITFDMGGTSTDVSLADGQIRRTTEGSIEGWPIRVPMMDIHTVGAGGGSIAYRDAGGALRVGPESAGSDPGPACYGRGGQHLTVTDANLLLGRLVPARFLGGRMALDREAARRAATDLARSFGMTVEDLAEGVLQVANAKMEQAIRVISIERGHDPRRFTLVPFGGAGPMHALFLAEALGIPRVLVPRYPGVLSALGLTLADFVRDYSRTVMWDLDAVTARDIRQALMPLLEQGLQDLRNQGFSDRDIRLEPALDLRYKGQSFELVVPLTDYSPEAIARAFHQAHEGRYGYARTEAPVEVVNLRVTARGVRPKPPAPSYPAALSPEPKEARTGTQRVRFAGRWMETPVYERDRLRPGHRIPGPALIVQEDATTVVPPDWQGRVDGWLNLVFEKSPSIAPSIGIMKTTFSD